MEQRNWNELIFSPIIFDENLFFPNQGIKTCSLTQFIFISNSNQGWKPNLVFQVHIMKSFMKSGNKTTIASYKVKSDNKFIKESQI